MDIIEVQIRTKFRKSNKYDRNEKKTVIKIILTPSVIILNKKSHLTFDRKIISVGEKTRWKYNSASGAILSSHLAARKQQI